MKMNKTIILKEYSFIFIGNKNEGKNVGVDKKTFEELESFVLKNSETVQYLKLGQNKKYKFLQAQNYVGVIQTKSGITIEILPKIADLEDGKSEREKEILIKMLKTLKKSPFKNFNKANLKSTNMPLLEIFISMFLEELSKLIKKGIKSDYISKSENLKFMKGKLKISKQIKQNYIHKERFFVEYCEFSRDRLENRLIKATLKFLYSKSKSNSNKKRIREFLFVFDKIKISYNFKSDFDKVKLNRQMKDYEQTLLWCKTFLLENSFSPYKGREVAFALLFDMNLLFESYVGHYLKKKGLDITLQDNKHHLAYLRGQGKFKLRPDIVINRKKNRNIVIADTKWKVLTEDKTHYGISQGDMYQLYAYGTKYKKCKNMYLIYPKNNKISGKKYNYLKGGKLNLNIVFFDLVKDKFRRSYG